MPEFAEGGIVEAIGYRHVSMLVREDGDTFVIHLPHGETADTRRILTQAQDELRQTGNLGDYSYSLKRYEEFRKRLDEES